ncbi:hypothetical protein [Kerstersia similis]|uniref:hypothetical protein n=1 Tax=Kerstersia similis TaxID=206505 RepID=UPI0039F09048
MLSGIGSWLLGLAAMLVVPIVLGEILWRRFLDHRQNTERKPGVVPLALLFGIVGPPVGMAAFLLVASWLERDMPNSRPAADMLIVLFFFAYVAGGVPALICGGVMGALRKRLRGWLAIAGSVVLGGVLAFIFFKLTGLYVDLQEGWRALMCGAVGALAASSIAYGVWRREVKA